MFQGIWIGNVTTWSEIGPYVIQQRSAESRSRSDKCSSRRKSAEARLRVPLRRHLVPALFGFAQRAFRLRPDGCWWRLYGVCWGIVVTLGPTCSARLGNGSNLRFSGSSAGAEGLCQL